MDGHALHCTLWAYATLGVALDEVLRAVLERAAQSQMVDVLPQYQAKTLWACSVLGITPGAPKLGRRPHHAGGDAARAPVSSSLRCRRPLFHSVLYMPPPAKRRGRVGKCHQLLLVLKCVRGVVVYCDEEWKLHPVLNGEIMHGAATLRRR
eukprot:gene58128-biopygen3185